VRGCKNRLGAHKICPPDKTIVEQVLRETTNN